MSSADQDDVNLNYLEGVRMNVIRDITKNGVPKDNESLNTLLKAVDGGSRVILTKKRLAQDNDNNQTQQQTQLMIAEILRASPTARQSLKRTTPLDTVEMVVPVAGETTIGTQEVKYKDIMNKDQ